MKHAIVAALAVGALAADISHGTSPGKNNAAHADISIPAGYRNWGLISIAREDGKLDDLRAILGNAAAVKAARDGSAHYPDGAVIARLAWDYLPLAESAQAFGQPQSHVAGAPKNGIQFMVKDSKKYAATGGWGFAQFEGGKDKNDAAPDTCFACHTIVKERDFVFSRYASAGTNGVHP